MPKSRIAQKLNDVTLLGPPVKNPLSVEEKHLFRECGLEPTSVFYNRMIVRSIKFHCSLYKKPQKSNDCIAKLSCGNYIMIDRIIQSVSEVYVLARQISKTNLNIVGSSSSVKVPHIVPCTIDVYGQAKLIPAAFIVSKCILLSVNNNNFLTSFPNNFEKD